MNVRCFTAVTVVADIGFNTMRVFLHDLVWKADPEAYLRRIDRFLGLADRHGIGVMLVFFDGVWNPFPVAGEQPSPTPHLHNSQWVQSPGAEILGDLERHDELEAYVKGVVGRFRSDPRVVVWDLFNEPDNLNRPAYIAYEAPNKEELAFALMTAASWGLYGIFLHTGQVQMGDPANGRYKAFLWVGVAYVPPASAVLPSWRIE